MYIDIIKACEIGDIETVTKFFKSEEAQSLTDISFSSMLVTSAKAGNLEIIETILESPFSPKELLRTEDIELIAHAAFTSRNLELLKHTLQHPKILSSKDHELIGKLAHHASINKGVKVIEYLLDEFPDNPSLVKKIKDGDILKLSSIVGDLSVIELLFSRENIKKHLDIHMEDDSLFEHANRNKHYHILNYFIFDLNIELTKNIKNYMDLDSEAMKMFKSRELKISLEGNLNENNESNTKKLKI